MKTAFSFSFAVLLAILLTGGTALADHSHPPLRREVRTRDLKPRRTSSMLINPNAFPDLPTARQAEVAAAAADLDLTNIQCDILIGMRKKKELFYFFSITDVATFKTHLAQDIHPRLTSTSEILSVAAQPVTAVNIAFSKTGLEALKVDLGATGDIGDASFAGGQFSGFAALGDASDANWIDGFRGNTTHGVLILASDTVDNIEAELASLLKAFGTSIAERHKLQGSSRPGDQEGHEHFGYMDGISQPAVDGFIPVASRLPGQIPIEPGVILLGEQGDVGSSPAWTKDGSFLAFRQLKQRVPEFNKFLRDNPLNVEGLTREENSDLLGARMVGRWKSGAPIDLSPRRDNKTLADDPRLNNDFTFAHPGSDITSDISRCPFSAHIRKTKPRSDIGTNRNHIMRAGIPYGPEVTQAETDSDTSSSEPSLERGLAFVAYQSALRTGFIFMQQSWANSATFPPRKNRRPGVDPIIGVIPNQAQFDVDRVIGGLDPDQPTRDITLESEFVVSRGGEYFFSPSISSVLDTLSV